MKKRSPIAYAGKCANVRNVIPPHLPVTLLEHSADSKGLPEDTVRWEGSGALVPGWSQKAALSPPGVPRLHSRVGLSSLGHLCGCPHHMGCLRLAPALTSIQTLFWPHPPTSPKKDTQAVAFLSQISVACVSSPRAAG